MVTKNDRPAVPSPSVLMTRPLQVEDLGLLLDLLPPEYWSCNHLKGPLPEFWASLLDQRATDAFGVFAQTPDGREEIVSFGMSFFAAPALVEWVHRAGDSSLGDETLQRWLSGDQPYLNHEQVRLANSGAGLDLVSCWYGYRHDNLDANYAIQRHAETFISTYSGYRMREVIAVGYTKEARRILGNLGLQLRRSLPTPEGTIVSPFLMGLTAAEFPQQLGSMAAGFMRYTPPRLFLSDAEQALLRAALDGQRDQELARLLEVSIAAIKKRWLSIYGKAAPVLGTGRESSSGDHRGPEKKRRVLAYIRAHPEELRPVRRRKSDVASRLIP